VALVGLVTAGGLLWWRGGKPAAPPARATVSERATPPPRTAPRDALAPPRDGREARERLRTRAPEAPRTHEIGAKVYAEAVQAGEKNPGQKAFRADAKAYFEHNAELAEEKAAREGITLDELEELTYMGLLAMHLRRWDEVAQVAGHELSAEDRRLGDELISSASNELKAKIREQVQKDASADDRWAAIQQMQASFVDKYQAITKISPQNYDLLLSLPFMSNGQ
jgi:hypothetical protein